MQLFGRKPGWKTVTGAAILFVVVLIAIVEGGFHNSDLYDLSLSQIRSDERVIKALGSPVEAGWWITGGLEVSEKTGHGELGYTIRGPKSSAEVLVIGDKRFDWNISTLMVRIDGQPDLVLVEQEK